MKDRVWKEEAAAKSHLGEWVSDARGLPAYKFSASLPLESKAADGKAYPLDPDPFFILGNYRLTLFPRASGIYRILSGERGWMRLNEAAEGYQPNSASLSIKKSGKIARHELLGLSGVCSDQARSTRYFGCGHACYEMKIDEETALRRTLAVAPSTDEDPGIPALVIMVSVCNESSQPVEYCYTESLFAHVVLGIELNIPEDKKAVRFSSEARIQPDSSSIFVQFSAHSDDPGILRPPNEANRYSLYPPIVHLSAPRARNPKDADIRLACHEAGGGAAQLEATVSFTLDAGATKELCFVVALCPDASTKALDQWIDRLPPATGEPLFADQWQSALGTFLDLEDPLFRRELTWNSHALLAMATYNSFYDETFIPQGMTYDYQMDLTAAPRDHLQHAMAAAYIRPALAKSTIRYVLSKMTEQGEIKYTDFGFGRTSNSAWNTSDQQLYLFQSLGEYLRITRDYAFLDEKTTYLPRQAGMEGTVLEKLDRAMSYLRDEVGLGPHGLVRLMNSDWSDMVFADRSVLRSWGTAESHMNSTMALAVMPNLIRQLEAYADLPHASQKAEALRICQSMGLYLDRLGKAFYRDLGDRKYSIRLYFDQNSPFGDDNMHIEPQSHLLQAQSFPVERKKALWAEVRTRLLEGEVLGPRQREKPVLGGLIDPYVSENGGFWYSLAGQMILGVASFDPQAAMELLRQMSFDNYARHYPDYWTGLWSAADTINASPSAAIAGLPRPDNQGLWISFASYCAHAHAWPIYCWSLIQENLKDVGPNF